MPMELDCHELKAQARARMRASEPPFWLLTLLFLLLTEGVSAAASLSGAAYIALPPAGEDTLPFFLAVLIALYTTVMNFGYQIWALRTARQQNPGFHSLMDGFSIAGRVLLMEVNIYLRSFLWSLVYSIPATLLLFPFSAVLPPVLELLLSYGVVLLLARMIYYRYAMAPYLLIDHPEWGPFAPVRESAQMMRGWKRELFRLDLSFIGWYALSWFLPLGVEIALDPAPFVELSQMTNLDLTAVLLGLDVAWHAVLFSALVQMAVSLWLKPYTAVSFAGFYQARMQQTASPPPVWGPYDGPER